MLSSLAATVFLFSSATWITFKSRRHEIHTFTHTDQTQFITAGDRHVVAIGTKVKNMTQSENKMLQVTYHHDWRTCIFEWNGNFEL